MLFYHYICLSKYIYTYAAGSCFSFALNIHWYMLCAY